MNYLKELQKLFAQQDDFLVRTLNCGKTVHVISLDTMVDSKKVCDFVLQPLAYLNDVENLDNVLKSLTLGSSVHKAPNFDAALQDFLNGYTLVTLQDE